MNNKTKENIMNNMSLAMVRNIAYSQINKINKKIKEEIEVDSTLTRYKSFNDIVHITIMQEDDYLMDKVNVVQKLNRHLVYYKDNAIKVSIIYGRIYRVSMSMLESDCLIDYIRICSCCFYDFNHIDFSRGFILANTIKKEEEKN